ncbi:hypothetical protein GCM10010129_51010 [Streptomyces fumigatiscleroticus]|nr:hypothetical protein GCM10010129_51010 [Streptomyces fumigatiscleroticus]
MRLAGLFVAGSVAVVAASCAAGGADGPPAGGGDITAGPWDGSPASPARTPAAPPPAGPTWHPDGSAAPTGTGTPHSPVAPEATRGSPAPHASARPNRSVDGTTPAPEVPAWLPPGPGSPDTDGVPDPQSVYDRLRAPDRCADALRTISLAPPTDEWRVLRGLANGCLAVQGQGGSWEAAARDHAALAGRAGSCKGGAAYRVLGGLLEFHRRHPGTTVRLHGSPGGAPACVYRIAGVDVGGDAAARPGDLVLIELRGTYFDPAELLRDGSVLVGGRRADAPPALVSRSGDRLVVSAVVPAVTAQAPVTVDVRVRYGGTEVREEDAFTVAVPDTGTGTGTGTPSVSPS